MPQQWLVQVPLLVWIPPWQACSPLQVTVHIEPAQSTPAWQACSPTQVTVHVVAPAQRTPSRHGRLGWVHTTSQGTPVGHDRMRWSVLTIRQTWPTHVPPAAPHTLSQGTPSMPESPEQAQNNAR